MTRLPLRWLLVLLGGAVAFWLAGERLRAVKRVDPSPELAVALPLFIQVAMAGGDRFLAANMAYVRGLVTETAKMGPDDYRLLAKLQTDVSWLNPAHEDNYYTAAAILSWNEQVEAAQTILRRASLVRAYDYQPAFYYSFNLYHFKGDSLGASEWLRSAAAKLPEGDERLVMTNFAARWLDRSKDLELAIRVVEAMAKEARRPDFRQYLLQRAQRLRDLARLRQAVLLYEERSGHPPARLDQLVAAGLLDHLPSDPFGFGFALDAKGQPILLNSPPR